MQIFRQYVIYIVHFYIEEIQFWDGVWHSCCMHVEWWEKFLNHFQLEACECKIAATYVSCLNVSGIKNLFLWRKTKSTKHWKVLLIIFCYCLNCCNAEVYTCLWNCIIFSISQYLQKWSLQEMVIEKVRLITQQVITTSLKQGTMFFKD